MARLQSAEMLTKQISHAIDSFIREESEKFVEKAMKDYEVKLRDIVAKTALRLSSEVDMISMEDRLRIEVRIK